MTELALEPEWEFTENQEFLFEPHRYKVGKGGRNGTKSWGFGRGLLIQGYDRPLRILCAREVQKSIKESVHQLLKDQVALLGLEGFYTVLQNEIRGINGTLISFVGLSNLTAYTIKSYEGYDICWVEEAALVTKRSWDILLPTIRKDGSEIWVTFNPELDTDDTWVRFIENTPEDCVVMDMSFDTNPWLTKTAEQERQTFLRQVENGSRRQDEYDNIWLGHCKPAVEGAIYPVEVLRVLEEKRLCAVPYDPTFKVYTVWDLGFTDNMAIGFVQKTATALFLIDYIEDTQQTYEHFVNEIKDRKYNLAKSFIPHDARKHTAQTGKSDKEILEKLGLEVEVIPNIGVQAGIDAARLMFPRVYFDKDKCTPLFNRLRRYARNVNSNDEPTKPKHDENSHGADMFRYLAVIESSLTNEDWDDEVHYPEVSVV